MGRRNLIFLIYLLINLILTVHCSVPRRIWSGKDIASSELHDPTLENRVLVASLSSEFKDEVVARIEENFAGDPVYIKFIGLDALQHENGDEYGAVVMINRCISWGMSPKVESFIERHEENDHMIVLTTSGDGEWQPDCKGRTYDAIATASVRTDVNAVADKISEKIRVLLARGARREG
jgi:hypothetical protein